MQLSKLRKGSRKILPAHVKFKYMSLGVLLPPSSILASQQRVLKVADMEAACQVNQREIPLPEFSAELPSGETQKSMNKIYALFLHEARSNFDYGKEANCDDWGQGHKLEKQEGVIRKNKSNQNKRWTAITSKLMIRMYAQADKAHQIKKFRLAKTEKQIQRLFLESHGLYVQLMELKRSLESTPQNDQRQQSRILNSPKQIHENFNEDSEKLSEKIAKVKQTIQKKQIQCKKLAEEQQNLGAEKVQFLMLLLKNGYHQSDGIWWILAKLAQNNQQVSPNNLADIVDPLTKQLIVSEYERLRKEKKAEVLPKIKQGQKQKEQNERSRYQSLRHVSYSKLMDISPEEKTSHIYREAQSYIVDWVRKERWKIRSLKHRQAHNQTHDSKKGDWRNAQIIRLKRAYSKEKSDQMLEYIFGSSNYYHKSGPFLFGNFEVIRKDSIINHDSAIRSVDHLTRNNTSN